MTEKPDLNAFTGDHLISQTPPEGWGHLQTRSRPMPDGDTIHHVHFLHTAKQTAALGSFTSSKETNQPTTFLAENKKDSSDFTQQARMTEVPYPDTSEFCGDHLVGEYAPDGWEHIESVTSRVGRWSTHIDCYYRHKETGQYYVGEIARGNTECQDNMFTDADGDQSTDFEDPALITPVRRETIWEPTHRWVPDEPQTPTETTRSLAEELHRAEKLLTTLKPAIDNLKKQLSSTLPEGDSDLDGYSCRVTVPRRVDVKQLAETYPASDYPEFYSFPAKVDMTEVKKHIPPVELDDYKTPGNPIVKVIKQ